MAHISKTHVPSDPVRHRVDVLALLYGIFVGVSLGLTGGGGSTFAIPLLVYGIGIDFRRAVALSLAVVGLTALYGAVLQARRGVVLWRAGAILGIGGVVTAPLGAWLGTFLPERTSLLLFAALMVWIGAQMFRSGPSDEEFSRSWLTCTRDPGAELRFHWGCAAKLLAAGILTGVLSGIFGVGAGFLIVPALLLVAAVSIERATATSLVAMFLISASGFCANARNLYASDLGVAAWFLGGAGVGMTLGAYGKTYLPAQILKKGFALMVLATAGYVLVRNL